MHLSKTWFCNQMPHGCESSSLRVCSYSHPPCLVLLSECHSLFLYFFLNQFLPTSLPQSTVCDRLLFLNTVVYSLQEASYQCFACGHSH